MLGFIDACGWLADRSLHRHALIWDARDEEWALWCRHTDRIAQVVGWNGVVIDPELREANAFFTSPSRFEAFPLADRHVDGLVMAAHHMTDEQAWYALCLRTAKRLRGEAGCT